MKGSKYRITNYVSSHKLSEPSKAFVQQISNDSTPSSLKAALSNDRWTKAMEEKMDALQKNQTWDLVLLPRGKKKVGCRWVYTIKYKADGSIERYKARLVAKGYTWTYGAGYTETFALVGKINTYPEHEVVNETLRLSNGSPGLFRKAYPGYTIPAGWTILLVTPALHLTSDTLGSIGVQSMALQDLDSLVISKNFMPFGDGLRQCAGAEYARAFLSTFLHVLVTKYRYISPLPSYFDLSISPEVANPDSAYMFCDRA
ncbi:cytochrome P450 85A1-like [Pyrus x bretschneideri]|uniref:cytochrome P450 85A1-like n=1 Tax=Pyrus x bretschneideri TaxID=225117 RepID=UPI00202E3717|nr:cytochrome P450 85A1-like [Pyrus x bretschneideri]